MIFLIWLDEDDADMVEEEDVVDTCWVALLLATMFLISAIEFCISPRLRLMSTAAELLDVELDCFEEEEEEDEEDEDWRAEDMRRCVEDVLAIREDVVVEELLLDDEDTCLLLELLLLRSSCAAEAVIGAVLLPLASDDDEDDAFDEPNKLWPARVGGVGGPISPVLLLLPVSEARSDISRRGNRNCDRRVATDGPERLMTILLLMLDIAGSF